MRLFLNTPRSGYDEDIASARVANRYRQLTTITAAPTVNL